MCTSFKLFARPQDVSVHRQTLMGLAIFGVMFSHWFGFQSITTGILFGLSVLFCKFVFTGGLLFLSGFGLYYSFSTKQDIQAFYKRRLLRLYIPFLLLSFPLYSFFLIAKDGYGLLDYFGQLSTVYFWFSGNYGGMWYVSISMLLYFLFPFLYGFAFLRDSRCSSVLIRFFLLLLFLYVIMYVLISFDVDYFSKIEIGMEKIPLFLIGMVFAYIVKNRKISYNQYFWILGMVMMLYFLLTMLNHNFQNYWINNAASIFQKLFFMPVLCVFFNMIERRRVGSRVIVFFNWFGHYSLELYILHLHFFVFFQNSFVNRFLPIVWQATFAMLLAIVLCVPVNKLITRIVKRQ